MTDDQIAISRAVTADMPDEDQKLLVEVSRLPRKRPRMRPPVRKDGYALLVVAAVLSVAFYLWVGLAVVLGVLVFGLLLFATAIGGLGARREAIDRALAPSWCPRCGRPAKQRHSTLADAGQRRPLCEDDESMCPGPTASGT